MSSEDRSGAGSIVRSYPEFLGGSDVSPRTLHGCWRPQHSAALGCHRCLCMSNDFEIRGECPGETSHRFRRERMTRGIDTQPPFSIAS
jgi:hypothetical protein